jgi:dipeptidase D
MKDLRPERVWRYFDEILKIPRLSKHEEKIIAYLGEFASAHSLPFRKDDAGNCLITKPASAGYENRATIVLQSHLDMVGEKLTESDHDFSKDPIRVKIEDGWMTAEGTTLGADDGIGIAATLAILASDDIMHGPLECLFTADEESGMTGAFGLQEGFIQGKILLNLDSEDEGEIFIGCAGGIDTVGRIKKKARPVHSNRVALRFTVDGLQGGHSGDEIHKGFGNAIKIMNRMLWNMDKRFAVNLVSFRGGKLRNAIPRDAQATIVVKEKHLGHLKKYYNTFVEMITRETRTIEPGFIMTMEEVGVPGLCYKKGFQRRLLNMLYACPHGVISWSQDIPGLVETSSNLAVLNDHHTEYMEVLTSQRSSVESAKLDIAHRVEALITLAGGEATHSEGYPGWKPDKDSEILRISEKIYKNLFNTNPEVKAIHAGLECGLFLQKYPDLDMISFGPTIKGAHTPDERIDIETVSKFWDFLLEILRQAPERVE